MADKRAIGHAYNIDFLNVVFAASSLFLFGATISMVWDDYDREWKNYQRGFVQLEAEVTRRNLEQAGQAVNFQELEELNARRAQAELQVAENQQNIDALQEQLEEVDFQLFRSTQEQQFTKAIYDADRYELEVLQQEDPEAAESVRPEVDGLYEQWIELGLEVERLTAERDGLREEVGVFTSQVTEIDSEIRLLTSETTRLQGLLDDLAPSVIDDYFLNAPLLDFMAPTLRVRQVITPDVVDDVNFTRVSKMDRCTTCHLAIDRTGFEEYPQPFTTHPRLDVYVGSNSSHTLEQTGCTVCHEGMGQSITFRDAAHTPRDDDQLIHWEEEYDWEESHLWDYPMLPANTTEASCTKCHQDTVYVPEANVLNEAYGLYERAGCYACHLTEGFENLRKPGPNLSRLSSKLTPDWVARWIRDPRSVKASTWMPKFWYNSNSSSPEDALRNEVEIDATVAYLFASSDVHEFAVPNVPSGEIERGQGVVESVGCLACHVVNENRADAGVRRAFGQPLQNIGNKTTVEWLFDWVRDPSHYSPDTYMPNLRLTAQEAADVSAYLSSLTGSAGTEPAVTYDQDFSDSVLLDYLRSVVPNDEALEMIAAMEPTDRTVELGRRVIGRYGCYSCHDIKGFENTQAIGTELSEEGSKLLPRFDFAFVDIPHTKLSWLEQKMLNPRSYDDNRDLQPLERLRMPDYGMSAEEAQLLTTAIMSFQSDVQPARARVAGSARTDALNNGRNLVRRRNCVACHTIENDGGDYQDLVADPSLAPPLLTPEGAKVHPEWLYAFFKGPITIRPWLDVRMPTFALDDAHWNQAIDYLGAISDVVGPFRTHDLDQGLDDGSGSELFDLLRCQQCHVLDTIPEDQPTDNLAPDLRMARERLQPDWILDWLRAPLDIQPGTRMPMFWAEYPGSFYPQLDNDAEAQIRAVRDYLLTLTGGPRPAALTPTNTAND